MSTKLGVGDKAPDFKFESPWEKERKFYEITGKKPAVLVFMRYIGCPVCQLAMADIKRDIKLIEKKGASLFVVLQSSSSNIVSVAKKEDWPFTIICDPQGNLFKKYNVEPGGILKYLHPAGLIAVIRATFKGYMHGKFEGRETQLPAVFIVAPDKTITYAYYGKNISDIPSPGIIASQIKH
jgi:peroxiredoxin